MNLKKLGEDKDYHTSKLSQVHRQLAFAGIAVIWIFAITVDNTIEIEKGLIIPLVLFVTALVLDLTHLTYQAIVWGVWHWGLIHIKKIVDQESEIGESRILTGISWFLYISKIIALIAGYFLLIVHLLDKVVIE